VVDMMGKCHRLPCLWPVVMRLSPRNIDTDLSLNRTVQPVSIMGARPPSEYFNPGTRCAGTVNDGAIVAVPDEVANSLLPSGCMIGDVNGDMLLLGVMR